MAADTGLQPYLRRRTDPRPVRVSAANHRPYTSGSRRSRDPFGSAAILSTANPTAVARSQASSSAMRFPASVPLRPHADLAAKHVERNASHVHEESVGIRLTFRDGGGDHEGCDARCSAKCLDPVMAYSPAGVRLATARVLAMSPPEPASETIVPHQCP